MPRGRPRSFDTVDQLQEGIEQYWQECDEALYTKTYKDGTTIDVHEPYSVSGLADSLGVCRDTLHEYSRGKYDTKEHPFSDTIKKAIAKIERDKVAKASMGLYNPTIAIFDLKNNHGFRDEKNLALDGRVEFTEVVRKVVKA